MTHTCPSHEPGSAACRERHGCPCNPCRTASGRARKRRAVTSDMVPAEVVRQHVDRLLAAGSSLHGISVAAGLSPRHLPYIMGKARRVHLDTARAILAVGASEWIDGAGTARRLQALAYLGWSIDRLSRELGHSSRSLWRWTQGARIRADRAQAVRVLYERLWDTPAPRLWARDGGPTQAIRYAQKHRWAPPMAWDDGYGPHGIDNPDATPYGVRDAERKTGCWADILDLAEQGTPLVDLCRRLSVTPAAVERSCYRHDRADLWVRLRPSRLAGERWKEGAA